ncbi:hypothetical protein D3C81_2277450 [compost metagenome]
MPINDRIDVMIRDMHDKRLAPYPELPVCLFGPVVLVPVTPPDSAPGEFVA